MTVLKPYVALACVAFMVGFVGYWMVGRAMTMGPPTTGPAYEASGPAALADFAPGKRI